MNDRTIPDRGPRFRDLLDWWAEHTRRGNEPGGMLCEHAARPARDYLAFAEQVPVTASPRTLALLGTTLDDSAGVLASLPIRERIAGFEYLSESVHTL